MNRPDAFQRSVVRRMQIDFYAMLNAAADKVVARHPEKDRSQVQGNLAAGMAGSLILNLARRGNGNLGETVERLIATIENAADKGDLEEVEEPC